MKGKRTIGAVLGAMLALGGIFMPASSATAAPASVAPATTTCPLYNGYYDYFTGTHTDSYGVWSLPSYDGGVTVDSFRVKTGGTTCAGNVYTSNVTGPFAHPVLARVWYKDSSGTAHSHTPVSVPMTLINEPNSTLYNLGAVPAGDLYQVQILKMSNGPSTGGGCGNIVAGGGSTPCGARSRG